MPAFDRSGPTGQGPGSGRGFGPCRSNGQGYDPVSDERLPWGGRLMQNMRRHCRAFAGGNRAADRRGRNGAMDGTGPLNRGMRGGQRGDGGGWG